MSIECVEVFLFQKNTFVEHSNSLKSHVKRSRSLFPEEVDPCLSAYVRPNITGDSGVSTGVTNVVYLTASSYRL